MIGDYIKDLGEQVSGVEGYIEQSKSNIENTGRNVLDNTSYLGDEIKSQFKGLYNSFDYNSDSSFVSGEARPLHPNMFWQFTGAKFIGVTRVPQTISKVAIKGSQLWKTTKIPKVKLRLPKKIGKVSTSGSKVRRIALRQVPKISPGLKTLKASIKKNPKKAGLISGTLGSMLINHGNTASTTDWDLMPPKKRRLRSWV